ncbi:hypothetical protein H6F89_33620 [Cyanobacteria bacterium FACHB-63]|nr:hypothetical protein [Cyanobacteria bacterium FACHB-63]
MILSKKVLLAAAIAGSTVTVFPMADAAIANGNQRLAQCTKELNDAYPYRVDSDVYYKHVQLCVNTLASQSPVETLGQCVSGLNQVYPYRADSDVNNRHIQICSSLLQNQQSNRPQPSQPQGGVIFVPAQGGMMQPAPSGNGRAISTCMKNLMYEQRLVCTRSYCSQLSREDGWGGWQLQTVRTEISEAAAVQACQNAR